MTVKSVITSAILLMLFLLAIGVASTIMDGVSKRNSIRIIGGGIGRLP